MAFCFLALSMIFFMVGLVVLLSPEPVLRKPAQMAAATGNIPESRSRAGSQPDPAPNLQFISKPGGSGGKLMNLAWVTVGGRIYVQHPVKGELMAHVLGQVIFAELWQQRRGSEVPWTPTGNVFAGFWLEGNQLLLNWQNRFYLLDESTELSDADIQRDFLPHARKFAQSDQTAEVYFSYPPAVWHIDDIGKFRVDSVHGSSLRYRVGGIGRFIHASGDSGRALVVEDFEGGGGQDMVWSGYQVGEQGIKES
jgi:hypothetical protein